MNKLRRIALPGLLLTGILCQQSAFGDEQTLSLHVLDCGVIHGMESAAFLPGVEDRTGPIVLSGDLYHSALNRSLRVAPAFNIDREKTTDSMQVIEQFLADHGAELFIQHEPESGPKTPAVLQ